MGDSDVVEQLAHETELLGRGATPEERRVNAARFTRRVAARLNWRGWGNLRALGGSGVLGLEVDKLIHRHSGEVVLIVRLSSGINAAPTWEYMGKETGEHYVAPMHETELLTDPAMQFDAILATLARMDTRLENIERSVEGRARADRLALGAA